MRRSASRKPAQPLAKPSYFPPENVLERTMPPALVGQQEFENYHFRNFDLTQTSLAGRRFSDCLFENCNLAGASLANTGLQNVAFESCKLLGLPFHACRDLLFDVHFDRCQLDYALFWGKNMPNTRFVDCSLRGADFTRTNLTGALFQECRLAEAVFSQTNLSGADLTTAQDIVLDPEQNELKKTRFALQSLPGLLTKYGLLVV